MSTEPANPSREPAHSPKGTDSPASVHSSGVNIIDARIRNAPLAIVVNVNP